MKIAVIGAKGLPAQQGGIEQHCAEICARMAAWGHEVDLFARPSYNGTSWFHHDIYHGVRVITLPSLPLRGIDAFLNSALAAIMTLRRPYDVVFFHALGPSLFSWIPKLVTTSKVISVCHGLDWQRAKWGRFSSLMLRLGEKTAAHCADDIIVVSHALQSYFSQAHARETTYIPNAPAKYADSDPNFAYGQSLGLTANKYVLFLGRIVPEKCPDLLLEAFSKLQPAGWKLVFVGGGSDTEEFSTDLQKRATGRMDIVFTGQLKGKFLAEIVRGSGLFALPSDLEGLPLAMLEAMREGIPVLASDILVHQQLLGRDRGVLFKAGDLESCIEALDWSINHSGNLAEMAHAAQKHIQRHYDWDGITIETLNLCFALLGSSPDVSLPIISTQGKKYFRHRM
ncbi:Putative teichuronic acid biosynthesis glycosyltransferase TuaC [Acaryochloris thomasi RCC1774]|uniref:Teichuronic acid biosynthesis glycosyltransferase TuaC n=1 Tax=Acaryochloris thomasi RCC1774 TaxID=1764569 RepID=A0A2W1JI99_9CYAN|nr:glycosyltransferase family 4 protein [Acaryochloris thomasi]PZD73198.1 Putative teichuronic acid biosynthesis glycosyltransferase TuaC [Acaryochloris thomasi RCC1774]